jgi:hypothetical protein
MRIWKGSKMVFDRKVAGNVAGPENRRPECDLNAELRCSRYPYKATVPQTSQSFSYYLHSHAKNKGTLHRYASLKLIRSTIAPQHFVGQ